MVDAGGRRVFGRTAVRRSVLAVVLAVLLAGVVGPVPTASAVEYPGGRHIYSVALGAIPPAGATGTTWVRLAMYYFFADGTVREGFWFWSRSQAVGVVNTGITSAGCDNCNIRTAPGFQPTGPGQVLHGTYTNSGDTVTITWSEGSRETWRVSHPAADLARLDFVSSNYGVTVGWGFGSNASSDYSVRMENIPRKAYNGRFAGVGPDGVGDSRTSVMNVQLFTRCHANCLSLLSAPSTACTTCPGGATASRIRYYLAGTGRRTFYEHFCTCLDAGCYQGGSHRKPLLQVIGDTGTFHGWVGVEASNFTANTGYFAVNYHVDL